MKKFVIFIFVGLSANCFANNCDKEINALITQVAYTTNVVVRDIPDPRFQPRTYSQYQIDQGQLVPLLKSTRGDMWRAVENFIENVKSQCASEAARSKDR